MQGRYVLAVLTTSLDRTDASQLWFPIVDGGGDKENPGGRRHT